MNQNLRFVDGATAKLRRLNGYTFEYRLAPAEIAKGQTPRPVCGLVAQEVVQVIPEAVEINADGEHFMNYNMLIPVMIESIKEKDVEIADLRARLERVEALLGAN